MNTTKKHSEVTMSNKQTAVQKLANKLSVNDRARYNGAIEEALEEEKENLIDAYDYATMSRVYNDGEDYYNENFTDNE
jgi:hypothetical protein